VWVSIGVPLAGIIFANSRASPIEISLYAIAIEGFRRQTALKG
jgi:hypothetical protein